MVVAALLRATAFKNPLLRTLVPAVGLAYGLQGAVAIPSILAQTEKYYDLSGSATYLSCTALSLVLPVLRSRFAAQGVAGVKAGGVTGGTAGAGLAGLLRQGAWDWRKLVLSAAVSIWATRLGTYLFSRISADGKDSRFDSIRGSPPKFLGAFFAQATWVSLCALPIIAVNSLPAAAFPAITSTIASSLLWTDVAGVILYVGGFALEAAADRQKSAWLKGKREKTHDEEFLTKGFWSWVRYPNYSGEITLWTGIATLAGGTLVRAAGIPGVGLPGGLGGQLLAVGMAGISPAFVTFLLTQVSGIPMSEKKYDQRYGDRDDYKKWKNNTPALFPKLKY